jgi:hypothetical protein
MLGKDAHQGMVFSSDVRLAGLRVTGDRSPPGHAAVVIVNTRYRSRHREAVSVITTRECSRKTTKKLDKAVNKEDTASIAADSWPVP